MSKELVARIRKLDSFHLLCFFNHFGKEIVSSLDLDKQTLISHMSTSEQKIKPELSQIIDLPANQNHATISKANAVLVARNTLEAMARHPNFEKGLEDALDGFADDEMPADIILAVGFAATMIILAATTKLRIRFKDGKVEGEVIKEAATPEMLKEVVGPLAKAARKAIPVASPE